MEQKKRTVGETSLVSLKLSLANAESLRSVDFNEHLVLTFED